MTPIGENPRGDARYRDKGQLPAEPPVSMQGSVAQQPALQQVQQQPAPRQPQYAKSEGLTPGLPPDLPQRQDNVHMMPWNKPAAQTPAPQTPAPQRNTATGTEAANASGRQAKGNDDMYAVITDYLRQQMEANKEESDEDKAKRERTEKRLKRLAAVGDVLGAFGKAYQRARYDRDVQLPNLGERAQARIDKAKAERDNRKAAWLNAAIMAAKMGDQKAMNELKKKLTEEKAERDRQKAENEKAYNDTRIKYTQALADAARRRAETDENYKNRVIEEKIRQNDMRNKIEWQKVRVQEERARRSGLQAKYPYHDEDGKLRYTYTQKGAEMLNNPRYTRDNIKTTTTERGGLTTTSTTKTKVMSNTKGGRIKINW